MASSHTILSSPSTPPEIIIRILQSCDDFTELRNLVRVSRRVYSVWRANAPPIIWHVAPKVIPHFYLALVTVRATAIVHETYKTGQLPPRIRPQALDGRHRKPNPGELREVLNLQHFVECAEWRYRRDDFEVEDGAYRFFGKLITRLLDSEAISAEPEGWEEIGDLARFYSVAYTTLLLGAILAPAYNEPFCPPSASSTLAAQDEDHQTQTRTSLVRKMRDAEKQGLDSIDITQHDIDYLLQFPVCQLQTDVSTQAAVFGEVAHWFIEHSLAESEAHEPFEPSKYLRNRLMYSKLFYVGEGAWPEATLLWESFTSGSREDGRILFCAAMHCIHMFDFLLTWLDGANGDGRSRPKRKGKAKVVLHGAFQPEKVEIPKDAMGAKYGRTRSYATARRSPIPDCVLAFTALQRSDLFKNDDVDDPDVEIPHIPPYPLTFFAFLLARDFGIRLVKGDVGIYWAPISQANSG